MKISRTLFTIILALTSQSSFALLIDFEDQGVAVGTQNNLASGVGFVSSGFNFDPGPINTSGLNDLHIHNENGIGDNGSIHLGSHDDLVMSLTSGVFSIESLSFAGFTTEGDLDVVGTFMGGGTISNLFTANGIADEYETFMFSGAWNNLTSLSFNYQGIGANGFFVDDILVNAAVPEPSIISLFGLGLLGLGFAHRRKA